MPDSAFEAGGLRGSTDWSLPEDWRLVSTKCDAALEIIRYCHTDANRVSTLSLTHLGDVTSAIQLIREIPAQLRSPGVEELAVAERKREVSSVSYRPKASKLGIASLIVNPVGTIAGTAIGMAARTAGRHAMAHTLFDVDDWLEQALKWVEIRAVAAQLERVFSNQPIHPRDDVFDQELGRRVYWFSFRSSRSWTNSEEPLTSVPLGFNFTPLIATNETSRIAADLESQRHSIHLLGLSPFNPGLMKIDELERKIKKGKRVPEMEQAWQWAVQGDADRQRFVMPYARRMEWTVG